MSVTNKGYDPNSGVRKITITTGPQLHPLSAPTNAAKNYYCLGLDSKGFQYQIDLQAMPVGVTIEQIQPNQVWWVEKRTSLYRLYLYAGQYDTATKQVNSTVALPIDPNTPFLTASGGTISGNLTVSGDATISGNLNVDGSITFSTAPSVLGKWATSTSTALPLAATNEISISVSGYSNYLINLNTQCTNGDAATAHNAVVSLRETTTATTLQTRNAAMNANSPVTIPMTWIYAANPPTVYNFAGYLNQGGAAPGTAVSYISVIGFN